MTCSDCRFYREGNDHHTGWCHAKAPEAYVGPVGHGPVDIIWPPVQADDACGDHQERPEATKRAATVWVATMEFMRSADGDVFTVLGVYPDEEAATERLYEYARELAPSVGEGYRIALPAVGSDDMAHFDVIETELSEVEEDAADWDAWGAVHEVTR